MEIQPYPPITLPSPVMSLAVDATGTLWAGGMGGVASYDGGDWTAHLTGLPLTGVAGLALTGSRLLAGGIEGLAYASSQGAGWTYARIEGQPGTVAALVVSPAFAADSTALAGTLGSGVLRTEDGGANWSPVNFGLEDLEITALAWGGGEHVLVGTASGLYRSTNGGRAWRAVEGTGAGVVVALLYLDDNRVLAALEDGGLWRSDDGGASWTPLPADLPDDTLPTVFYAAGDTLLLGTGDGLLRSTDDGLSWTRTTGGVIFSLAGAGAQVYAGTSTGIVRSDDGGINWTPLPVPPIHDLRRIVVVGNVPCVAGRYSLMLRYSDDSTGWEPVEGSPLPLTLVKVARDGLLYVSGPDGLFRSGDGGRVWSTVIAGEQGHVSQITVRSDGLGWASSADGKYLMRSQDGGATWLNGHTPFGVLPVIALEAAADIVLAATYDPRKQAAYLWRSVDDGASWRPGAKVEMPWAAVSAYHTPPLVAMGNGVFLQNDAGEWARVALPVEGVIRRVLGDDRRLLALTTGGVFQSTDSAASWQHLAAIDLPPDQILDFALAGDALYLLLVGGLVYRADL